MYLRGFVRMFELMKSVATGKRSIMDICRMCIGFDFFWVNLFMFLLLFDNGSGEVGALFIIMCFLG